MFFDKRRAMIKIKDLGYEYYDRNEEGYLTDMVKAIRGINFNAEKGEFIAIAGRNGSGKSTFAKILNRLTDVITGTVVIAGYDANNSANTIHIRKKVGMVFQNPDEQLIGTVVEEDVAFGAENIGVPTEELRDRVNEAILSVGLVEGYNGDDKGERASLKYVNEIKTACKRRINDLSGGEKQKVSIAGVLAMKPDCIVLDESTSMLDPASRRQVLDVMTKLNKEHKITVILITHIMEELMLADTIYVFDKGRIVLKGSKETVFRDKEILESYGLAVPETVELSRMLYQHGVIRKNTCYSVSEIVQAIKIEHPHSFMIEKNVPYIDKGKEKVHPNSAILLNEVSVLYGKKKVLDNVSCSIAKGDYAVIVGETGAGKSTLLSLIPGLLKPDKGHVYVDGVDIWDRATNIKEIRCKIGYLFQYPEQQLFGSNVYEDVVFGPRNVGISEVQAESRAYAAIKLVGLPENVYDTNINKLSGGERRRVALAGVLAMKPEYLILDEPTAGLDPEGARQMLDIIDALHRDAGITIIIVSHDIDTISKRANRIIALDEGKLVADGKAINTFAQMYRNAKRKQDEKAILQMPVLMQLFTKLASAGMEIPKYTLDMDEAIQIVKGALYD